MTHVLDQQAIQFHHLEGQIQNIKLLYEQKYFSFHTFSSTVHFKHLSNLINRLWYQLSEALLQYIEDPSLHKGEALIKLYEGFVKEFETKFDQVKFIQIANAASDQFPSKPLSLTYLCILSIKYYAYISPVLSFSIVIKYKISN